MIALAPRDGEGEVGEADRVKSMSVSPSEHTLPLPDSRACCIALQGIAGRGQDSYCINRNTVAVMVDLGGIKLNKYNWYLAP